MTEPEQDVMVNTLPESFLRELLKSDTSEKIIDEPPKWLLDGVIQWCEQEGRVEEARGKIIERDDQGLPLIIPGSSYAITLSAVKWDLLKAGVTLIVNLSLANPINWIAGTTAAASMTVISLMQNLQELSEEEKQLLSRIGQIKKDKYSKTSRWPKLDELRDFSPGMSSDAVEGALNSLVDKRLVKKSEDAFAVVI